MRVLVTSQAIPGHVNPNLALIDALQRRGHDVAVYSGAAARSRFERIGARFHPFDPAMDERLTRVILPANGRSEAAAVTDSRTALLRFRHTNAVLHEWFLGTIRQQMRDLRRIYEVERPEVLVADLTLLAPILLLKELLPIPVAVFSVIPCCPIPGPQAPPWGRGLPPPRTAVARIRCAVERRAIEWLTRDLTAAANRIRAEHGLPRMAGRIGDEYGRTALFMVLSAPSLDYGRTDLPPTVQYVGPCALPDAADPEPEWLASLPRPIVHVTEGTVHTEAPRVLRAAVAGLRDLPMQVVITTGGHRTAADLRLGPIAPNIRVEQFVPHHHLFPRTDVLVTTGGAGTVTRALEAGVPIVIVPIGWEHAENAERIVDAGVGVRLNPSACTPARLRAAVQRVLADPRYRQNAARVGAELAAQGGPARAAELVEALGARGSI